MLLLGGVIAAPVAAWLVRHIDHRSLGVVVAGMILVTNSERVLGLVGVGAETAQAVRILILTGTVALTTALLLTQRRKKKLAAAMATGAERRGRSAGARGGLSSACVAGADATLGQWPQMSVGRASVMDSSVMATVAFSRPSWLTMNAPGHHRRDRAREHGDEQPVVHVRCSRTCGR